MKYMSQSQRENYVIIFLSRNMVNNSSLTSILDIIIYGQQIHYTFIN